MPTLFKILLFLLLQQGGKINKSNGADSINLETVLLARNMTLVIQSDELTLNQLIILCTQHDTGCEVYPEGPNQEGRHRASVRFRNLPYTEKTKIMEHAKPLLNNASVQWIEE